jgi:hypothetical protein
VAMEVTDSFLPELSLGTGHDGIKMTAFELIIWIVHGTDLLTGA